MIREELIQKVIINNLPLAKELWSSNKTNNRDSSPEGYAAVICAIKVIFNLSDSCIKKEAIITDGDRDGSIDAVVLDSNNKTIHLLNVSNTGKGLGYKEEKNILDDIENNFLDEDNDLLVLNKRLKDKLIAARKEYFENDWRFIVHIIRIKALPGALSLGTKGKEFKAKYSKGNLILRDLNNLITTYIKKHKKNENKWYIKFIDKNSFFKTSGTALVGKIKLLDLIKLLKDTNNKQGDLFDDNVRVDQEDKGLTEEILKSLRQDPENFYIYHNGFTFSCSKIEPKGLKCFGLLGPQIINGCQSLNAIYKATQKNNLSQRNLERAIALCRVFALESKEKVDAVCQATNTQRKIQTWDLRSNDEIQKILEKTLDLLGYVYNRKIPKKNKSILITDLAQWIYAAKFGKPADAKNKKSQLFDVKEGKKSIYHKKIFNEKTLSINDLNRICSIAKFVRNKSTRFVRKEDKALVSNADLHIIAALYWIRNKKIETSYKRVIKEIKKIIARQKELEAQGFSLNRLFTKNSDTWELLKKKLHIRTKCC